MEEQTNQKANLLFVANSCAQVQLKLISGWSHNLKNNGLANDSTQDVKEQARFRKVGHIL